MEKSILTFNDLPEVVAQLRDEVMSLKSLLAEQRSVNNAKTVDTHVPMSVAEAAEDLGIPKGTLYMKLSEGTIPANAIAFTVTNWTSGWKPPERIPYRCQTRN